MTPLAAAALLLGSAVTLPAEAADDVPSTGERLLDARCSPCHAIGPYGASVMPEAPPLRAIVQLYPPHLLAEALAEGMVTGHAAMPEIAFPPGEVAAIIAYLEKL